MVLLIEEEQLNLVESQEEEEPETDNIKHQMETQPNEQADVTIRIRCIWGGLTSL